MAIIRIKAPRSVTMQPQQDFMELLKRQNIALSRNDTKKLATELDKVPPTTQPTAPPGETIGVSKDNTKEYADLWLVVVSYVLLVAGVLLGTLIASMVTGVSFAPPQGTLTSIGLLALFFVMAQAIERLMEPVAEINFKVFGSAKIEKQHKRDQNIKAAEKETDQQKRQQSADEAANNAAEANGIAANTKVVIWALASFVAMLVTGATKVYFLKVIGFNGVPDYLNILINGLVIGGGTKPLHDLITLIENKNTGNSTGQSGSNE